MQNGMGIPHSTFGIRHWKWWAVQVMLLPGATARRIYSPSRLFIGLTAPLDAFKVQSLRFQVVSVCTFQGFRFVDSRFAF
jgi:hypothetical protein